MSIFLDVYWNSKNMNLLYDVYWGLKILKFDADSMMFIESLKILSPKNEPISWCLLKVQKFQNSTPIPWCLLRAKNSKIWCQFHDVYWKSKNPKPKHISTNFTSVLWIKTQKLQLLRVNLPKFKTSTNFHPPTNPKLPNYNFITSKLYFEMSKLNETS
jgi:hypothetical protein